MSKSHDVLNKVFIYLSDLTKEEMTSVPKNADTLYDITDEVMRNGAYIYKGNIAFYVPPASIIKIEYVKGVCEDCGGKGCKNCTDDEDEEDDG